MSTTASYGTTTSYPPAPENSHNQYETDHGRTFPTSNYQASDELHPEEIEPSLSAPILYHSESLSEDNQLVAERISRVYFYTAVAFATTLASAYVFAGLGLANVVITIMTTGPITLIALIGIQILLIQKTIYTPKEESSAKYTLFGAHAIFQGLVLSPLVLINPSAFVASSVMTTAALGGLGILSMSLEENFEKYEKILMIALGALTFLTFGSVYMTGAAGALAHKVCMIGGLALFGTLVIYDTHKARNEALSPKFDEINHAMGIYLDALNILIRLFKSHLRKK